MKPAVYGLQVAHIQSSHIPPHPRPSAQL